MLKSLEQRPSLNIKIRQSLFAYMHTAQGGAAADTPRRRGGDSANAHSIRSGSGPRRRGPRRSFRRKARGARPGSAPRRPRPTMATATACPPPPRQGRARISRALCRLPSLRLRFALVPSPRRSPKVGPGLATCLRPPYPGVLRRGRQAPTVWRWPHITSAGGITPPPLFSPAGPLPSRAGRSSEPHALARRTAAHAAAPKPATRASPGTGILAVFSRHGASLGAASGPERRTAATWPRHKRTSEPPPGPNACILEGGLSRENWRSCP